jgi:hypothetical protein
MVAGVDVEFDKHQFVDLKFPALRVELDDAMWRVEHRRTLHPSDRRTRGIVGMGWESTIGKSGMESVSSGGEIHLDGHVVGGFLRAPPILMDERRRQQVRGLWREQ